MLLSVLGGMEHILHDVTPTRQRLYWVMVDLTHAALLALCYTNGPVHGLCLHRDSDAGLLCAAGRSAAAERTLLASVRYLIFALVGSGLFLIGVILTYSVTGHLLFPQLHQAIAALWQEADLPPAHDRGHRPDGVGPCY